MRTMIRTNNKVTVIGRVAKIQEFGKNVASITVAIDNGKDREGNEIKSTFVDMKCFEPRVYNFCKTGMLVAVTAHLSNNKYEKDGQTVYAMDIVTDCIECLESKTVVDAREAEKTAKIEAEKAAAAAPKKRGRKKAA